MKRLKRIFLILCVALLAYEVSSCSQRETARDNTVQASPAKAAVDSMVSPVPTESTADADKRSGQNNDTEQAKESVDSAQTEENAVKTETPAFETANGDIVLPELEIPIVPSGSNGVAPDPEPEQNNTNIWIDDNGDIWLPEVP